MRKNWEDEAWEDYLYWQTQDKEITHTGTGRISRVTMRPMSLYESKDSNGNISLEKLFANQYNITDKVDKNLDDIAFVLCRGGWLRACVQNDEKSYSRNISTECSNERTKIYGGAYSYAYKL